MQFLKHLSFVALIIRNRIYNALKDEIKRPEKRPNLMAIPAALKELEKIEMVRLIIVLFHGAPDMKLRGINSVYKLN